MGTLKVSHTACQTSCSTGSATLHCQCHRSATPQQWSPAQTQSATLKLGGPALQCRTHKDKGEVILSWKADSLKGTLIHKRVGGGSNLNSLRWFSASLGYSCQLWSLERESEWSREGERFKKQQWQSDSLIPREGWNSWMIALHLPGEASREGQPSGDSIHIG